MAVAKIVTVSAPARLHFGLLDCGDSSLRLFGGAGAAIDGFRTVVAAKSSHEWMLDSARIASLSNRAIRDAHALCSRLDAAGLSPCHITVQSMPEEHIGLGSKTSLLLAITLAANTINNSQLRRQQIVDLTQRGGTSGIGINTFWSGGVITDTGHDEPKGQRDFQPSSARTPRQHPSVLTSVPIASNLRVRLFRDPSGTNVDGIAERQIFASAMPLPDIENLRSIAAVYHGIVPALLYNDVSLLAQGFRELNSSGMKALELELQSDNTKRWLQSCWEQNIPAGLSSFGPTIFSIAPVNSRLHDLASRAAEKNDISELGEYSFDTQGVRITHATK